MAKKAKKTPRPKQTAMQRACQEANARIREHGHYRKLFGQQGAKELTELEAKCTEPVKTALRLFAAGRIDHIRRIKMQSRPVSLSIFEENAETCRDAFVMACVQIIAAGYEKHDADMIQHEETFDEMNRITESIPQQFYNDNVNRQTVQLIATPCVDILESTAIATIYWKKITEKNDPYDWCMKAKTLIEECASKEYQACLEQKEQEVRLFMAKSILQHLKRLEMNLMGAMDKMKEPSARQMFTSRQVPMSTPLLNTQYSLMSVPLVKDTIETAVKNGLDPLIIAHMIFDEAAGTSIMAKVHYEMCTKYPQEVINWTAIKTAALEKEKGSLSPLVDCMICGIFTDRFFSSTLANTVNPENKPSDEDIVIDCAKPRFLSKTNGRVKDEPNGLEAIFLSQVFTEVTGIAAYPTLRIRLKWKDVLTSLGLNETEAAAMCGYMEACCACRGSNLMLQTYMKHCLEAKQPDQEANDEKDTIDPNTIERMKSENACRIQAIQTKLQKSEQSARHEKAVADEQIQALLCENEQLSKEIERMRAERTLLENAIQDMASRIPPEEETDEEQDTAAYPSDIGKNERIVVFGGTDNWITFQRQRFPNITFVSPNGIPNSDVFANAKIIFINTWVCKHKHVLQIQSAAKNAVILWFPKKGINNCSKYIIEAYAKLMEVSNEGKDNDL